MAAAAHMLASMQVAEARPGYELWRPNREKAECKAMKAVVAFVLPVSAGLLLVITIGGWERLLGTSVAVMTIVWAGLYVLFAFLVMRWSRGILPVAQRWRSSSRSLPRSQHPTGSRVRRTDLTLPRCPRTCSAFSP